MKHAISVDMKHHSALRWNLTENMIVLRRFQLLKIADIPNKFVGNVGQVHGMVPLVNEISAIFSVSTFTRLVVSVSVSHELFSTASKYHVYEIVVFN